MKWPSLILDKRSWEMAGDVPGELVSEKARRAQRNKDRLKGVQLKFGGGPLAYRAEGAGSRVLCDRHLDFRREKGEQWRLTGEAFEVLQCDDCLLEKGADHEL